MVFFTCNHCGESVKKAAVEKHYNFKCRGARKSVSCMDCQKDFYGEDYTAHTQCITEAEKYSGKDYVPKEQKNTGRRRQEGWMEVIRSIMDTKELSNEMKLAFHKLKASDNVPRKKAKFVNFVSNSMKLRVDQAEQIWAILNEVLSRMKEYDLDAAELSKAHEAKEKEQEAKNKEKETKDKEQEAKDEEHEKKVDSTETKNTKPEPAKQSAEGKVEEKKSAKKSKKRKVDKQVQNTIEEDEEEEILQMVEETVKKDEGIAGVSGEPKKKKNKKRDETVTEKETVVAEQEPTVSTTTPDEFEWGLVMEFTVRKYADGINLDRLKRKVHRMYLNKRGVAVLTDKEKLKFDKKYTKYIKKCNFKVENGIVRVVEQLD